MELKRAKIADLGSGEGRLDQRATMLPVFAIRRIDSTVEKRHGQALSERLQPKVFGIQAQHRLYVLGVHRAYHPRVQEPDLMRLPIDGVLALDLGKIDAFGMFFGVFD